MTSSRHHAVFRLILAGAAVALAGCASNGDYYYGPDTAYYDQPANHYYGGSGTSGYYERNYYSPAPRYTTHIEQHDYWYYPAADCYYDPRVRVYMYHDHGRWVRAHEPPHHLRPHLSNHVVVRSRHERPYEEHAQHRERYARHERGPEPRGIHQAIASQPRAKEVRRGAPHSSATERGRDERRVPDDQRGNLHNTRPYERILERGQERQEDAHRARTHKSAVQVEAGRGGGIGARSAERREAPVVVVPAKRPETQAARIIRDKEQARDKAAAGDTKQGGKARQDDPRRSSKRPPGQDDAIKLVISPAD